MYLDKGMMQDILFGVSWEIAEQYFWSSDVLKLSATIHNCGFGSGGNDPAALLATSVQSPLLVSLLVLLCRYL